MINRTDLKMFKSAAVNNTGSNGGRMSASEVISGAMANLFPPVGDAERITGSTLYRKFFEKVHQDGSDTLFDAQLYAERGTEGQDTFSYFAATANTQAAITGSERRYAVGKLLDNVDPGATEIRIEVEEGNEDTFVAGDAIRITSKASLDDLGGAVEFGEIDDVDVDSGSVLIITLVDPLVNGFLASVSRAMAVYAYGNLAATISDFAVTAAGDLDYDDSQIVLNNIGTIEQTWTLLFTNATNFTVTGDTVGSAGAGTVGGGAAPNNPSWTKPYFTLSALGFSGTPQAGDTIVFKTHPAAIPMWARRIVPANADVAGSNTAAFRMRGQRG